MENNVSARLANAKSAGVKIISAIEIILSIPKLLIALLRISIWLQIGELGAFMWEFLWVFCIPAAILTAGILTYKLKNIGRIMNIVLASLMFISSVFIIIRLKVAPVFIGAMGATFRQFFEPTYVFLPYSFDFYIIKILLPMLALFLLYFFTRPKVKEQFK